MEEDAHGVEIEEAVDHGVGYCCVEGEGGESEEEEDGEESWTGEGVCGCEAEYPYRERVLEGVACEHEWYGHGDDGDDDDDDDDR